MLIVAVRTSQLDLMKDGAFFRLQELRDELAVLQRQATKAVNEDSSKSQPSSIVKTWYRCKNLCALARVLRVLTTCVLILFWLQFGFKCKGFGAQGH